MTGQGRRRARLLELFGNAAQGPAADHLEFDPTLARGLSYYTGPIFEVQVDGLSGSMGGGGRYDNLIGMFQKQQVAAVGFSLGLERVLLVMTEREMFPELGIGPELLCVAPRASLPRTCSRSQPPAGRRHASRSTPTPP